MEAILYNKDGVEAGHVELSDAIFGKEVNPGLIHRLFLLQRANARIAIAHTKDRGEVNGSTRKLYRQKGTGSARVGDSRSPTRMGGGVAFGPRNNRNFTLAMNKKERRLALLSLLSSKAANNQIKVLETLPTEAGKTKTMISLAKSMNIKTGVLAILPEDTHGFQGGRNVPNVKVIGANYLNPRDLLKYKDLVFTKASLEKAIALYS